MPEILFNLKDVGPQSYEEIDSKYRADLLSFAEKLVEKEHAPEIVQETFTELAMKKDDFDTLANIKAFLYITCRNGCLNFLRLSTQKD